MGISNPIGYTGSCLTYSKNEHRFNYTFDDNYFIEKIEELDDLVSTGWIKCQEQYDAYIREFNAINSVKLGLCLGRHEILNFAKEDYIFSEIEDVTDVVSLELVALKQLTAVTSLRGTKSVHIYVTGLTVCLVSALNACKKLNLDVILYHYDRDTDSYFPQAIKW